MTTRYDDDLIDIDDVDEDGNRLGPIDEGSISVSASGDGGGSGGRAYSEIVAREAELRIDGYYGFVRSNLPDTPIGKRVVNGLMRLARRERSSQAVRRRQRFEEAEKRAEYWLKRAGDKAKEAKEQAESILQRWTEAHLVQLEIRKRRVEHGLEAVEHERARWYTADRKKQNAELDAIKLSAEAYEYFQCRLEQYHIQRESSEDTAANRPRKDITGLLERIVEGKAKPEEVFTQGPWATELGVEFAIANAGKENPHWGHIEPMHGQVAERRRPRRRRMLRMGGEGGEEEQG